MSLAITCPQCGKKYQVANDLAGKRVRCQQCSVTFLVEAPPDSLTDPLLDLSALPAVPMTAPAAAPSLQAFAPPPVAVEGPSDSTMRLVSAGMVGLGVVMLGATFVMGQTQGAIYLAPLALAPLSLILGTAGVISPNVVRAAGKYGGHLPWQYKAAAWSLMALCLLATIGLIALVLVW
jgi:predicted Zn finger-like uncharacterized protein